MERKLLPRNKHINRKALLKLQEKQFSVIENNHYTCHTCIVSHILPSHTQPIIIVVVFLLTLDIIGVVER